jgi:hypothetical protein
VRLYNQWKGTATRQLPGPRGRRAACRLLGQLVKRPGQPIVIDGIGGLEFDNNGKAGSANTLFFNAGPGKGMRGLMGALVPR